MQFILPGLRLGLRGESCTLVLETPAPNRTIPARIGALSRWAYHRQDGLAQLAQARRSFEGKFSNDAERRLYFLRLAQASAKARAKKSQPKSAGASP